MDSKECRKRSKEAEARGDERAALYWSRREVGAQALPARVLFNSRHGSVFKLSPKQMSENGGWPYAIRKPMQAVTSRKQLERIIRNLLLPMGAGYRMQRFVVAESCVGSCSACYCEPAR